MKIEKKIQKEYFDKILKDEKNFELRLADWECNSGDVLVLREIDENRKYTGRELEKEVTYVVKTKDVKYFSKENIKKYGWQIISFK